MTCYDCKALGLDECIDAPLKDNTPAPFSETDTATLSLQGEPADAQERGDLYPDKIYIGLMHDGSFAVVNDEYAREYVLKDCQSKQPSTEDVKNTKIALAHYINADSYSSTFPDNEEDYKYLREQETLNRLTARQFIDDKMAEECSFEYKSYYSHKWDRDGERCEKCGDKDWFNSPICRGKQALGGKHD